MAKVGFLMSLPGYEEQIIQTHAGLIIQIVKAVMQADVRVQAEASIGQLRNFGETGLANALSSILDGSRDITVLRQHLDDEDTVIVEAILRGIQNPETLPQESQQGDAAAAAPGLAHMIHAAATGNAQALQVLGAMSEQMLASGGDMAKLSGVMKRLIDGERDADLLSKGMGPQGESLLTSILDELAKLQTH